MRNIKLLAWFNFLTDFSFVGPIAIIYYAHISGSFTFGMSIFSIAMLTQAILEVPTGVISDYFGRKGVIILGSTASVISIVSYALAIIWGYWLLVVGALFEGLARSLYSGNNDAFLHDTLKDSNSESEYHEYLGKTSAMFQASATIGALLSGIIASLSFTLLLWLSVIPQVIKLILSFMFREPKSFTKNSSNIYSHTKEALQLFIHNSKLRKLSLASMIGFATGEVGYQFRSAFINTLWPLWAVGFSKLLSSLGATLSFWYSGKAIKKYKELPILIATGVYSKIVNIFALVFPTVFSPLLMSTTSLCYGVSEVAENNLMQNEFTSHQRATTSSLNSLGGSLMFAVSSTLLGYFADTLGAARSLLVLTIIGISANLLHWSIFRSEKS